MLVRDTVGTVLVGGLPFVIIPFIIASGVLPFTVTVSPYLVTFISTLWALIIWMTLAILWTNYYLDLWIVSDRRVFSLDQIGLFNRRVTTWRMEHIQEISVIVENPLQALLNYGTLELETAGPSDAHSRIIGIPHPEKIRSLIMQQVSEFKRLLETNKTQESLLHTISHEVKGYLAKDAAALSSIVEGGLGAIPDSVKNIAGTALSQTRKGVDAVMNILDSANLKNGAMEMARAKFDARRAIIEIAEDIRPEAEHRGLSLNVIIDSGTYELYGDEGKLRRMVFRNLIDNAVRYTQKGGVHISLARSGNSIRFRIQDSGVGINENDMTRLFTEGGKGEQSSAVNPESTGYGLFIAKQVVDAHGGKIWAESDGAGTGSTFFVELPQST